ncbi:hypothetical protein CQA66_04160 [Helicobacter aurati]|uniref:Cell division topological specificity factor n=1 Tax=Helicobacter aurati TaxID=137778 RepID=A0A3D8J4Y3_9HELI|nr:cell division topological specificity factor MinE [Helicobacter aurati]RDU72513.1 hypothetical protein CQA66_04160 [Helicobacter aurati]
MFFRSKDNDVYAVSNSAYNAKQRLQVTLGNERVIAKGNFDDLRKEIVLVVEKYTCSPCHINMKADRNNGLNIMITDVNVNLD